MPRFRGTQPAGRPVAPILVHNGVMKTGKKTVRQSVSLPSNVAAQVRNLAKTRRLSANRMLVELIENGMEAEKRKQREFLRPCRAVPERDRSGGSQTAGRSDGADGLRRVMPKIERWDNLPAAVRRHLIDRMCERLPETQDRS